MRGSDINILPDYIDFLVRENSYSESSEPIRQYWDKMLKSRAIKRFLIRERFFIN